jgi:5,10-methenyltetrahydromethanopterin hydrogenase
MAKKTISAAATQRAKLRERLNKLIGVDQVAVEKKVLADAWPEVVKAVKRSSWEIVLPGVREHILEYANGVLEKPITAPKITDEEIKTEVTRLSKRAEDRRKRA